MPSFKQYFVENSNSPIRPIHRAVAIRKYKAVGDWFADMNISDEDLKKILSIESGKDISIEDAVSWTEQNMPCYGLKINGVNIAFWWMDSLFAKVVVNALEGDEDAKNKIVYKIKSDIQNIFNDHYYYREAERIVKLRKEMELTDKLKPETQNIFKGMIEEL